MPPPLRTTTLTALLFLSSAAAPFRRGLEQTDDWREREGEKKNREGSESTQKGFISYSELHGPICYGPYMFLNINIPPGMKDYF